MHPILIQIGAFSLHTYGLLVALGFVFAFHLAKREFERNDLSVGFLDNVILALMVFAILGARIFYFAMDGFRPLASDPFSFFRIWEGGLVFFGGFIFGMAFLLYYARRRGVPYLTLSDALTGPLLLGQTFGRLGCFFAGCCYGRPTDSFLGVVFNHPHSLAPQFQALHPTQLYEAGVNFLLLLGLVLNRPRFVRRGAPTVYYFFGYGIARFLIEFLRADDRGPMPLGLSPGQWVSLGLIAAGAALLSYVRRQAPR